MNDRDVWLATTLVELADTRDVDLDEVAHCRRLAVCLAQLLAPAEIAVFLADGSGCLRAAAASTERMSRLAVLGAGPGDRPAATAYACGQPVRNEPLSTASGRWPAFTAAARAAGFGTVSALPMWRHDEAVGGISVLGGDGQRLGVTEIRLAQVIAEAAAVAVLQWRALRDSTETARQLQHALDSRVLIEQAKGALAARLDISPEAAFGLLRGFARRHGRLLAEVAGATVRGELTATELLVSDESNGRRKAPR
jgi:GAF domain-containing protein